MDELIISFFYDVDNFCKELNSYFQHSLLSLDDKDISLEVPSALSLSEIMTICIVFHLSGYRTFKGYYKNFIIKYNAEYFLKLVSYNRFVDSTTLDVCDSHRIA